MVLSKIIPVVFLLGNYAARTNPSEFRSTVLPRAYYISPRGDDNNDGTRHSAFQSVERVNRLKINAGDSILFEAGAEFAGTLQLDAGKSGDPSHPVLVSTYGKGVAGIRAGNGTGVSLEQVSWVIVKKLKILGSGREKGNTRSGVVILTGTHIVLGELEISGFQKSGLQIDFSSEISVSDVFSHDNGFAGISVGEKSFSKKSNTQIHITYCRAENNPGDPTNLKNHSGNGIVVSNCTRVRIEYCTATNNGWGMPRKGNGPVGIWAFEADSVSIEHCLSFRNKTSSGGDDGGGFDFDGGVTHSVIQYCLSYENQGAGYCIFQYSNASAWHDNVYRFNISINDGEVSAARAGIFIWNSSLDSNQFYNNLFYNNTIWNRKASSLHYSEYSTRKGFAFYNNIFAGRDTLVRGNRGSDIFSGNQWSSLANGHAPLPAFEELDGPLPETANGIQNFRNFMVPVNSPLRNNGINLMESTEIPNGGSDFNGNTPPANGVGASFRETAYGPGFSGESWKDDKGAPVNAHGAGMLYFKDRYYLFGEIKKGDTRLVPGQNWEDYRVSAGGISCYSSEDLISWKYQGIALSTVTGDSTHDLDTSRVVERPKVIYNSQTRKFVMWMHVDKEDYSYARVGVAVSDRPEGPYQYLRSVRPNGQESRDMTLFQDEDGKAYLIYSSENNNTMQVCLLSEDYLSPAAQFSRILINQRREAPALFKHQGKYYLITSLCSGWSPNAALLSVSDSLMGNWQNLGNPCTGADAETTFDSQSTYVLPMKGGTDRFIFMADRWKKTDLPASAYLWLPFDLQNGAVEIKSPGKKQPDTLP